MVYEKIYTYLLAESAQSLVTFEEKEKGSQKVFLLI
jgi:hypothetical protein